MPYAPRVILRRALAAAAERNLVLKTGVEAEYSMLARNADGTIRVADERDVSDLPCYDARGLTRMLDHLTEVSRHMDALGWGNYANDHEDANGQFEQNFQYADALTTADRLIVLRLMMHTLAQRRGLYATFMPKPFGDKTGNGLHAHMSLWSADTDEPLFETDHDPRGLGLSPLAYGLRGRAAAPRHRPGGCAVPHGQLLQAHGSRSARLRVNLGARLRFLRRATTVRR